MNLLVLGANSDIAMAVAHVFAGQAGAAVCLASRDVQSLEKKARDIALRYQVKATALPFDALDFASHRAFYDGLDPKPDVVLLAFGTMPDQKAAERDFSLARHCLDVNFTGAMSILEIVAADFESKGRGCIIALSSPAGLRGRKTNYVYGAAKGALEVCLSGLRQRLFASGARVLTVLPGFVNTKMTEGMDLPQRLVAEPEEVAKDIYAAYVRNKDVVYSRWIWRWIMCIIRHVPERIFKRMNF